MSASGLIASAIGRLMNVEEVMERESWREAELGGGEHARVPLCLQIPHHLA
jgi:hypothetical protein